MNSYIYAETAFHHEGQISYLLELIDTAAAAGAKGIKFQVLIDAETFLSTEHKGYEQLKSFCLSKNQWSEILKYSESKGLDLIVLPLDSQAVELCKQFQIKYIEIHSVSFYDAPLAQSIKETQIPLIIGVGGRTIEEITSKIEFFGDQLEVLMTGFQAFPSDINDVKLGRIRKLKQLFPEKIIGYADHSAWDNEMAVTSNEYARILGAEVFEKHITLKEGDNKRTDFSAAVGVENFKKIVERLSFIDNCILNDDESFSEAEKKYRNRQKKVVPLRNLNKGAILTPDMLTTKMIDDSLDGFFNPAELIGKQLKQPVAKDHLIEKNMVE